MSLNLVCATNDDNVIMYEGVFGNTIDIRVVFLCDGSDTTNVYANEHHVGSLVYYEVIERMELGESLEDIIAVFLQSANVGR